MAPAADVPSAATTSAATTTGAGSHPQNRHARADDTTSVPAGTKTSAPGAAAGNDRGETAETAGLRGESPYVWSLQATVSPTCIRAGGTATVTVATAPGAAVGYVAEYAGRKSGAMPPFGYGYGGNAGGYADGAGQWTQTWTIRADAPVGPAKAIVVAASHQTHKQVDAPFTVVDPVTGHC
jgi:hypothetical protein